MMASACPTARCWRAMLCSRRLHKAGSSIRRSPSCRSRAQREAGSTCWRRCVNFGSHPESIGSSNRRSRRISRTSCASGSRRAYGGLAIWLAGDLGGAPGSARHRRARSRHEGAGPAAHLPVRGGPRHAGRGSRDRGDRRRAPQERQSESEQRGPSPKMDYATVIPVAVQLDNPFFRLFIAIGVIDVRRTLYTNGVVDTTSAPCRRPSTRFRRRQARTSRRRFRPCRSGMARSWWCPTELDPQIGFGYREQLADATGADAHVHLRARQ